MKRSIRLLGAAGMLFLCGCEAPAPTGESETRPTGENVLSEAAMYQALGGTVSFEKHIKPILEYKCVMCHDGDALPGKMNLTSREAAVRSGALGGFIVPGHPERSLLVTKIRSAEGHTKAMPPVGERITRDEIAILRRWISQGAAWPEGPAGKLSVDS